MADIQIKKGYAPGAMGRISELHGVYYHKNWRFGLYFEAKVARELSEFLSRYDEKRDGIWLAMKNGRVQGSIVIDGIHAKEEGAHLRWLIVSDALRGAGAGRRLVDKALDFCGEKGHKTIFLWTFEGLDSAKRLYENAGFELIKQKRGVQWGVEVNEQCFQKEHGSLAPHAHGCPWPTKIIGQPQLEQSIDSSSSVKATPFRKMTMR